MKKLLLTAAVCCPIVVHGEPTKLDIYSVEKNTCSEWKTYVSMPSYRLAQYLWFRGFVSGHNFVLTETQVPPNRMLQEADFEPYVTEKCNKNPRLSMVSIAFEFVKERRDASKVETGAVTPRQSGS